jgi:hypothetical protein
MDARDGGGKGFLEKATRSVSRRDHRPVRVPGQVALLMIGYGQMVRKAV